MCAGKFYFRPMRDGLLAVRFLACEERTRSTTHGCGACHLRGGLVKKCVRRNLQSEIQKTKTKNRYPWGFCQRVTDSSRKSWSRCLSSTGRIGEIFVLQIFRPQIKSPGGAKSGVSGFRSQYLVLAKDARFRLRQYPCCHHAASVGARGVKILNRDNPPPVQLSPIV